MRSSRICASLGPLESSSAVVKPLEQVVDGARRILPEVKRRGFGNNVNEAETKESCRPEAGPPLADGTPGGWWRHELSSRVKRSPMIFRQRERGRKRSVFTPSCSNYPLPWALGQARGYLSPLSPSPPFSSEICRSDNPNIRVPLCVPSTLPPFPASFSVNYFGKRGLKWCCSLRLAGIKVGVLG